MVEGKIHISRLAHADTNPRYLKNLGTFMTRKKDTPLDVQEVFDAIIIESSLKKKYGYPIEVIVDTIKHLNSLFEKSRDLPPTNAFFFTGSTANVDQTSHLKNVSESGSSAQQKIDRAFQDAVTEGVKFGKSKENIMDEIRQIMTAEDINLPKYINTSAQVIGFILRTFTHSGNRIQINDLDGFQGSGKILIDWIGKVFESGSEKPGGAAFQVGDFLSGIGEKKVAIHSEFHSPDLLRTLKNKTVILKIDGGNVQTTDKKKASRPGDPIKINQIIEIGADTAIVFDGRQLISKKQADRYIFLSNYYDNNGDVIKTEPVLKLTDKQLNFIGDKYDYFFTTAPNYLQRYSGEEYVRYAEILSRQFKILKNKGVKILYEFSGSTLRNTSFLADVLKGNIVSFSLNDGELNQLIKAINRDNKIGIDVHEGNDPLTIYENALALAKYLEVDRLHVHGHNLDISVRKNATRKELEKEVSALFHAKQRVTEWIRGKQSHEKTPRSDQTSRLLKSEGFANILKFADDLAKQLFPSDNKSTERNKLKNDIRQKCYYHIQNGYSIVVIPTKWIYDEAKITTSSGDIMAIVAALHALFTKISFIERAQKIFGL